MPQRNKNSILSSGNSGYSDKMSDCNQSSGKHIPKTQGLIGNNNLHQNEKDLDIYSNRSAGDFFDEFYSSKAAAFRKGIAINRGDGYYHGYINAIEDPEL
jgi:hypothetical protein